MCFSMCISGIADMHIVYTQKTSIKAASDIICSDPATSNSSNGNVTIYDLKPGHTYYVKVKMVDDNNKVIASSAPIDVVTAPEDFDEYSITQTSATSKTISVKWGKVAGVTAYKFSYSVTSPFSVTQKSTPIITKTVKENKITIPAKNTHAMSIQPS